MPISITLDSLLSDFKGKKSLTAATPTGTAAIAAAKATLSLKWEPRAVVVRSHIQTCALCDKTNEFLQGQYLASTLASGARRLTLVKEEYPNLPREFEQTYELLRACPSCIRAQDLIQQILFTPYWVYPEPSPSEVDQLCLLFGDE